MPILQPSEYDISYFDGELATYRHNAGYTSYERWYRYDGENSTGEYWKDLAAKFANSNQLSGLKVLEIGCAKGFLVEDLRDLGVDAYGLDVSQYAIDSVSQRDAQRIADFLEENPGGDTSSVPQYAPYFYTGDARTYLANFKRNEFDIVFSRRFLECIPLIDMESLISEMNRISRRQIHIIDEDLNNNFYTKQPLEWWLGFSFARTTRLISNQDELKELVK